MSFEEFTRKSVRLTKDPAITIQKRGSMGLNASAYELLKGEHEETDDGKLPVQLLFDKENQIVGLRPTSRDDPNAYLVRKQKLSPSYLVAGKMFFKHYGVELGVTRRYKVRKYEDGIVGFGLGDKHQVVSRQ